MDTFISHTGRVTPLDRVDVDTDQIIPKQFLKRIERTGYGEFLFHDWRALEDGSPDPTPISCSTGRSTREERFWYRRGPHHDGTRGRRLRGHRDLEAQEVRDGSGWTANFSIDPFRRHCLMSGLDDIGLTLTLESEIQAFEEARSS